MTAGLQRTAQRADRSGIGGTLRHVFGLEIELADAAAQCRSRRNGPGLAREIEFAAGDIGNHRRGDECGEQCEEARQRLQHSAECARVAQHAGGGREHHRTHPDRVDVVEMGALELDERRAQSQRLVDDKVGDERAHPGHRDDRIEPEDVLENAEDSELHQQKRDRHVEDEPDHATGMAVGHPREEVRPRDRAGIGVGDVDLELRNDDEGAGEGERDLRRRKHRLKRNEIHLRRLGGLVDRNEMADGHIGEKRTRQQLEHPRHDPAGPGRQECGPPSDRPACIARRQKAEEIDLFADLGDQREHHGRRGAERQEIERSAAGPAWPP